jgi:hypothetical protein
MKKTILLYGLLGGVLIAGLELIAYRFLVVEHSFEIYGGLVALLFSVLASGSGSSSREPRRPSSSAKSRFRFRCAWKRSHLPRRPNRSS